MYIDLNLEFGYGVSLLTIYIFNRGINTCDLLMVGRLNDPENEQHLLTREEHEVLSGHVINRNKDGVGERVEVGGGNVLP